MTNVFSGDPLARESVLQYLRGKIHHKEIQPGGAIDKAQIAAVLNVDITLVQDAVTVLIDEGLIERTEDGTLQIVVMTKRLAQEMMDLLGLLLVSAVDRLPEDFEQNGAVVSAAEAFSKAVVHGQENSEEVFRSFADAVFAGTQNRQLQRIGLPVVERSVSVIRRYDSEALLPMWADAFDAFPEVLATSPKEAARHLREFFVYLVNEIEYINPLSVVSEE